MLDEEVVQRGAESGDRLRASTKRQAHALERHGENDQNEPGPDPVGRALSVVRGDVRARRAKAARARVERECGENGQSNQGVRTNRKGPRTRRPPGVERYGEYGPRRGEAAPSQRGVRP